MKKITFFNILILLYILFATLGLLDSSYLTIKHYSAQPLACGFLNGCDIVTTSKYSSILGIPIALLGIFYYSFLALISIIYLANRNRLIVNTIFILNTITILIYGILIYIQAFLLKAFCTYCLISAIVSFLLFIVGTILFILEKRGKTDE